MPSQRSFATLNTKLRQAREQEDSLRAARNQLLANGAKQNVPRGQMAKAAGISRALMYNILNRTEPTENPPEFNTSQLFSQLEALAPSINDAAATVTALQHKRARMIAELIDEFPELDNNALGQIAGVSYESIRAVRIAR